MQAKGSRERLAWEGKLAERVGGSDGLGGPAGPNGPARPSGPNWAKRLGKIRIKLRERVGIKCQLSMRLARIIGGTYNLFQLLK